MGRAVSYPFTPKTTARLTPGDFWAIPLTDGRFGCGRVVGLLPAGGRFARVTFIAALVDWVGDHPPTAEAIAEARVLKPGRAHVNSIHAAGSQILGWARLAPGDEVSAGERIGMGYGQRAMQVSAEARFVGLREQQPEHRRVRSPLTEEMLQPMAAGDGILAPLSLLTDTELETLGRFVADNPGVVLWHSSAGSSDLEYLRFFPQLTALRLPDHLTTQLDSLDGLRHLPTSLQLLQLSPNERPLDLDILRRFDQLATLGVCGKVRSVDVISRLGTLRELSLRTVRLDDYSLLAPLKQLCNLRLLRGSTTDLTHLRDVENLEHLTLFAIRGLTDLDVLPQLGKLRSLDLDSLPRVARLPDLTDARALTHLRLQTMKGLRGIESIASAPNLEELTMTGLPSFDVEDFEPLVGHPTLRAVTINLGGYEKSAAVRELLGMPMADQTTHATWPPPTT